MSIQQEQTISLAHGVETENVDAHYFQNRQLKQGAAGWVLLIGLGVAYVISGDFAGWNFGLAQGGWGGMFLATLLMAAMYLCMCFSMAELSSMIPTAGGGYGFVRTAFGPWGGFFAGAAILLEYAIAPAAIAVFIGAYCESLFGVGGWPIYLAFYTVFIGIHVLGAGEALKVMFVITAVAAIALGLFIVAMVPHVEVANLFDIPASEAKGASSFLPFGYVGIWAAIPYAMWFFLAVEGVALAAEETKNPTRDLPRGLIGSMLLLLIFAAMILTVGPGAAGAMALMDSGNPLVAALEVVHGGSTWMSQFVNLVGLAGLIASFFSVIYAYSRQIFALSRAGYLPRKLSVTNRNKAPVHALVVPGVIGFGLSLTGQGDLLILVVVFGATLSYVLMMAAHIALRIRRPDMQRPYRTPGGIVTSSFALILAAIALVAGFLVDPKVMLGAAAIYGLFIAYFAFYSRHHLVSGTPEEEFAAIQKTEESPH